MSPFKGVYASLPVVDLERARTFYEKTLGLPVVNATPEEVYFDGGNHTQFFIYKRATHTKADNTAAAFQVDDIEKTMKDLRAKNVTFEEYDFPGLKTEDGIATTPDGRGAWCKDPEGNILSVYQPTKARTPTTVTH